MKNNHETTSDVVAVFCLFALVILSGAEIFATEAVLRT